uniref:NADH-ubiquinone oxidoreductase chain 4L n=1 Tax=Obrium sp. NS-2015 TaxID=1776756 RepID=A0A0U4K3Z0_9CUCU|nr:NADH dehydrogenase subunit 4L [Obrium sp. NS-2015]
MMVLFAMFMFFSALIVFVSNREHLLLMLLSLESMVLSLYWLIYLYLLSSDYNFFFSMVYLVVSVCESTLGLVILVSMIRTWGNDYVLTFSLLW